MDDTAGHCRQIVPLAICPDVYDLLFRALVESESEEHEYRTQELARLQRGASDLKEKLRRLDLDFLSAKVSQAIYTEIRTQWELELAGAESYVEAYGATRRRYEDECLALKDFASNAYSRFKTASDEDKRAMARNLLSNSSITNGIVQVSHKGFEMVLEANLQMTENAVKGSRSFMGAGRLRLIKLS